MTDVTVAYISFTLWKPSFLIALPGGRSTQQNAKKPLYSTYTIHSLHPFFCKDSFPSTPLQSNFYNHRAFNFGMQLGHKITYSHTKKIINYFLALPNGGLKHISHLAMVTKFLSSTLLGNASNQILATLQKMCCYVILFF